jgi:hypothetical protein
MNASDWNSSPKTSANGVTIPQFARSALIGDSDFAEPGLSLVSRANSQNGLLQECELGVYHSRIGRIVRSPGRRCEGSNRKLLCHDHGPCMHNDSWV